jgi:hypothetical protein
MRPARAVTLGQRWYAYILPSCTFRTELPVLGCWTSQQSIRLFQIVHNLADVRLIDWRSVDLDHLGHLCLPEVSLEFRAARLGLDIVGGMTSLAVFLHDLQIGSGLKCHGYKASGFTPSTRWPVTATTAVACRSPTLDCQ